MMISDIKLCDCAKCGRILLGRCHVEWYMAQPKFKIREINEVLRLDFHHYFRINGRPYCPICAGNDAKRVVLGKETDLLDRGCPSSVDKALAAMDDYGPAYGTSVN